MTRKLLTNWKCALNQYLGGRSILLRWHPYFSWDPNITTQAATRAPTKLVNKCVFYFMIHQDSLPSAPASDLQCRINSAREILISMRSSSLLYHSVERPNKVKNFSKSFLQSSANQIIRLFCPAANDFSRTMSWSERAKYLLHGESLSFLGVVWEFYQSLVRNKQLRVIVLAVDGFCH